MTEDQILSQFECLELREENQRLKTQLQTLEMRLRESERKEQPATWRPSKKTKNTTKKRADDFEALYKAVLARCEILNRKVKELGG